MERKLFGTDGVRGIANNYPMTPELVMQLGKAIACVLKNGKERPKILIGKDTRLSGYMIENALTSGICSMGSDVLLVGPMPTPAIAHLTKSFAADAGIVISASHNPAEENGIKIFDNAGFKLSDEKENEIEELVFSENIENKHIKGDKIGKAFRIDDAKGRYIEFAKASVKNISLKGIKIVLDCANGAAYHIAPDIFRELGADVVVLNNNPDGLNINLNCGALHPELIKEKVEEYNADVGIALDGDADRVIIADENGEFVNGDHIMAICAIELAKEDCLKKNTLVATVYSNLGLDDSLKEYGIDVVRVQNGDRYVIKEMLENDYNFGGEQSGHIIFLEHTSTGDGTIAALQVLSVMKKTSKKLSELKKFLVQYPQLILSANVKEKKQIEKLKAHGLIKKIENELKNNGRVIARYSGTENKVRVMVEGKDENLIKKYAESIIKEIKNEVGD